MEKLDHCTDYKKIKRNLDKYDKILRLKQQGLNQSEIAIIMECTQANISWYYKQEYFINLEENLRLETKMLDKGEIDIEEIN